jgi:molecular chaperone GrpE
MEPKEPAEETATGPIEEAAAAEEETAPTPGARQELTSVQLQDLKMMQDRLLRLRAEFDNYRKRETRDKRASWERAKGDLLKKLLPSLDDLHRVATLKPDETKSNAVIDGVALVQSNLLGALGRDGLKVIGEPGEPFDPHLHEAIGMWPAPTPEQQGTIAAVTMRGYQFGHQLLRPAQVQVYEGGAGEDLPDSPAPGADTAGAEATT